MSDIKLRLEGGYSRLLEGAHLLVRLDGGPFRGDLDFSPLGLARRNQPVDLRFQLAESVRGIGPGEFRWRLAPATALKARLLFAGNAFLGNFRVPAGHFAIQWDVEGLVEADARIPKFGWMATVAGRTRLLHAWVESFSEEITLAEAIGRTWSNFRDPLDAGEVSRLTGQQVTRTTWTGEARLTLGASWGIKTGWSLPVDAFPGSLRASLDAGVSWEAELGLATRGNFQLQLDRRRGNLRLRLRRRRLSTASIGTTVGARLTTSLRVRRLGPQLPDAADFFGAPLAAPVMRRINRELRRAASRKFEIALTAELARTRGREALIKATWADPDDGRFQSEYEQVLRGRFPKAREGLDVSGLLQRVGSRRHEIGFNFLNWLKLRRSTRRESAAVISLSPEGDLVYQQTEILDRMRDTWGETQFLRLLVRTTRGGDGIETSFSWSWGERGRFDRRELQRRLRIGSAVGVIPSPRLPAAAAFPLNLELVFLTLFSSQAVASIRLSSAERRWEALIGALEVSDPEGYASGSYRRDWIDYPEVRRLIDRDPVQAHLKTRYPVGGRSEFERRQVVSQYLQSRNFLKWMADWKEGRVEEVLRSVRPGLEIPLFVLFHRLAPAGERRSVAVISGDWEKLWGDADLLDAD